MNSSTDKPQILVLLSRFPYPLEKGDKLRAYYQLKELSKSYRITLFTTTDQKVSNKDLKRVAELCELVEVHYLTVGKRWFSLFIGLFSKWPFQVHYFFSISGRNTIRQLILENNFEHIYCQLVRSSEYVKNIHHIPKTIDYMDAFSAGVERRINKRKWYDKWLFRIEARRLKEYESKIFDFFEHHTIISKQDRDLIAHPSKQRIEIIPNGIAPHFFEEYPRQETYDFVFVGNMSYPPNIEAVQYIVAEILTDFPDATLLISGATPNSTVVKLAENNNQVHLTGWVDDIRDSYISGKIFLAPMMIGTGMQNKLLEAMALRTPCITTDLANNAIGAVDGEHILVANSPEAFHEKIRFLLNSEEKRKEIAQAAYTFVQDRYTWKKTTEDLIVLMRQNS